MIITGQQGVASDEKAAVTMVRMTDPNSYCLLFDSDGTLVDSEAINTQALADELSVHDIAEDALTLLHRYRGWRFKSVFDDLNNRHNVALDQAFEQSFRSRASQYFELKLQPIAHVADALQQLPDAKCVASNAPMDKLIQVLNKTDLIQFFNDRIFSAYDVGCFKPDPELFLHASRSMGFEAKQCIVIEDSIVGVQAAVAAGMKCVCYKPSDNTETTETPVVQAARDEGKLLNITNMRELVHSIQSLKEID